jgi:hypothetical protein
MYGLTSYGVTERRTVLTLVVRVVAAVVIGRRVRCGRTGPTPTL